MATLDYEIVQAFHELHDIALLVEDYEAAQVYSNAADLADAILKGHGSYVVPELVDALRSNANSGQSRETWLDCANEALDVTRRWLGWDKPLGAVNNQA